MVKCLNKNCDGFLNQDYIREPLRNGNYNFYCPACGKGFSNISLREVQNKIQLMRLTETRQRQYLFNTEKGNLHQRVDRELKAGRITKKRAEEIKGAKEGELLEKYFGAAEKEKWLRGVRSEKEKGELAKTKLEAPTTGYGQYLKKTLPAIYGSVAGLFLAALLGHPGFLIGPLLFGISVMIPSPESIGAVKQKADEIEKRYKRRLDRAKSAKGVTPDQMRNIIEAMKAEVELEKLIVEADKEKNALGIGRASGVIIAKDAFRGLGFIVLIGSLIINRVIPFAGLAGLVLGFVAYFSFGGKRTEKKSG